MPNRSKENVELLAKRITTLTTNLDAEALDMALLSSKLAEGKFPKTHLVQVENALSRAVRDLDDIKQTWVNLFKDLVDESK